MTLCGWWSFTHPGGSLLYVTGIASVMENLLLHSDCHVCINVGKFSEGNSAERIPEVVHLRCSIKLDSLRL